MGVGHYENFPVGSLVLPRRLRRPVHAIYAFARTADDIADEGEMTPEQRLAGLNALKQELDLLAAGKTAATPLVQHLFQAAIQPFNLPLQPFYDLLSAFSQDITVKRYQHFGDVADYCRRSANPVGRLMLHLFGKTDSVSLAQSDGICTALQLVNFYQDVAIDWQKDRIYLPQDEMAAFGVTENQLAEGRVDAAFQRLMLKQCTRAHNMLVGGSPLGKALGGRMGFELRLIVLGAQRILFHLDQVKYDVFRQRPTLGWKDWGVMIKRAVLQK
ncbi:squalene synthase HpnC [Stenoxybacter acetivorans]|uniref:squalene synthase HpnC n=1 Tax=Stenoxybacter acetivorans TaxID=422441 RepID=UPI00055AC343|nr:squalene synthase HpnC [Stenoxybacter acetivorans]